MLVLLFGSAASLLNGMTLKLLTYFFGMCCSLALARVMSALVFEHSGGEP